MMMHEELIPRGHPNRPGTKLEALKAIVFHYTANDAPGASDTMNAKYFGRVWHVGEDGNPAEWAWETRKDQSGYVIRDPGTGKPQLFKIEVPFRYGSTQVIVDEDSATIAIPPDEAAWACGDRNAGPWTPEFKGQRPLARNLFAFRQNYQSLSVEICNNASWEKAVDNAAEWAIGFLKGKGLEVDVEHSIMPQEPFVLAPKTVILERHFDLTNKKCPMPFVTSYEEWAKLVWRIHGAVKG